MSFIEDLASLEVITVTGQLNLKRKLKIKNDQGNEEEVNAFSFDDLFTNQRGTIALDADLSLVAATKIHVDHDTFTFVADDLGEAGEKLVKLHLDSVAAALNGRARIIASIKPSLKLNRGND